MQIQQHAERAAWTSMTSTPTAITSSRATAIPRRSWAPTGCCPRSARAAGRLYAESEFDLARLSGIRDALVEAGRSCVHAEPRRRRDRAALVGHLRLHARQRAPLPLGLNRRYATRLMGETASA